MKHFFAFLLGIASACAAPGEAPGAGLDVAGRVRDENLEKLSVYDLTLVKLRAGKELKDEENGKCNETFLAYFDELSEKNNVRDNTRFAQDDQFDYYVASVKMALIDFENHGGWPFRSTLRLTVAGTLKERTKDTDDSFLLFCAIFPSLSRGDVDHAAHCYKKIKGSDEFLTKTTDTWLEKYFKNEPVKAKFKKAAGIN